MVYVENKKYKQFIIINKHLYNEQERSVVEMNSNQTIGRSHSRKHYHEQSMDDFMKNIKKFNLRSQRYISPKPLLYMYAKNNTTNTIQKSRSRTLSNHKSQQSKSKRQKQKKQKEKQKSNSKSIKVKNKLQKIFKSEASESITHQMRNPAYFIQYCGDKLKKAEKYLEGKSGVGVYLCEEFLAILNQIVDKMVRTLDKQLREIQEKTQKQISRKYVQEIEKMKKKMKKMDKYVLQMNQIAENNNRLLYSLRLGSQLDIDHIFGRVVLGTDKCGGQGYSKDQYSSHQSSEVPEPPAQPNLSQKIKRFKQQLQLESPPHRPEKKLTKQKGNNLINEFIEPLCFPEPKQREQREEKESGRIRQAYDWQKQAYDDSLRKKYELKRQLKNQEIEINRKQSKNNDEKGRRLITQAYEEQEEEHQFRYEFRKTRKSR